MSACGFLKHKETSNTPGAPSPALGLPCCSTYCRVGSCPHSLVPELSLGGKGSAQDRPCSLPSDTQCGGCKQRTWTAPCRCEQLLKGWALSQHPDRCKTSHTGLHSLEETHSRLLIGTASPHQPWGRGFGCALVQLSSPLGHGGVECRMGTRCKYGEL